VTSKIGGNHDGLTCRSYYTGINYHITKPCHIISLII
jgi:hypothetical protein